MPEDLLVSVIIPSINPQKLLNLLNSLTRCKYKNLEVIIVFDYVKQLPTIDPNITVRFKNFIVIANERPLLKSCSVNKGIKASKGEYVLVIDEDNLVQEGTIETLVKFMEKHPEVGCAQPLVYTIDGSLQHYGAFWDKRLGIIRKPNIKRSKDFIYVDLVTDCILIRRSVINKIGLFSSEIPWGDNDADFALRAKKAGFKCAVVLTAKVLHDKKLNRITYKNVYDILHSKVIINKKYFNSYLFYIFLFLLLIYFGIYIPIKQGEFKDVLRYLRAAVSGTLDGIRGKYNISLIREDYKEA